MSKDSMSGAGPRRDKRIKDALEKGVEIEQPRDRKSGMDLLKEALGVKTKWNDGLKTKR